MKLHNSDIQDYSSNTALSLNKIMSFIVSSLGRFSGHVPLGESQKADPGHAAGTLCWPCNTLVLLWASVCGEGSLGIAALPADFASWQRKPENHYNIKKVFVQKVTATCNLSHSSSYSILQTAKCCSR